MKQQARMPGCKTHHGLIWSRLLHSRGQHHVAAAYSIR